MPKITETRPDITLVECDNFSEMVTFIGDQLGGMRHEPDRTYCTERVSAEIQVVEGDGGDVLSIFYNGRCFALHQNGSDIDAVVSPDEEY